MKNTPSYSVLVAPRAVKAFKKLERRYQKQIASALEKLGGDPLGVGAEKLRENPSFYRIRSGNYRIVYCVHHDREIICVAVIRHRSEAYRDLGSLEPSQILEAIENSRCNQPQIR